ncbi:MAG: recombinase family protein, partial [Eubacteriales bacterium]
FKREGFERLMQDVRMKNIECIMVKDFSRFGRDYIETGNYIEKILPFMGVRFISVADNFDSMSENAGNEKLAMNIKNLVNDMYAKDISQRITLAHRNAMENGSYIGAVAPLGYRIESIDGKRKLMIDDETAEIVRFIYQQYLSGISFTDIGKILYEKKIHRFTDYRMYQSIYWKEGQELHQWSDVSVRKILLNRVYTGDLYQGKTKRKPCGRNKNIEYVAEDELIVVKSTHEPIISEEDFINVKHLIERNSNNSRSSQIKHDNVPRAFKGVVYCGDCGKKLSERYHSLVDGSVVYTYRCKGTAYVDHRKCSNKSVKESDMELLFIEAVQNEFRTTKMKQKDMIAIHEHVIREKKNSYYKEKRKLEREKGIGTNKLSETYMDYKNGLLTKHDYELYRKKAKEDDKFIERYILELEKKLQKMNIRAKEETKFLRSLFKVKTKKLCKELVESLVDKIEVYGDGRIIIHFKFKGGDFNGN